MNTRNKPHRQIYNRQQLNKQILKNRQIVAPRKQKKLNIAQDIVKEIEKEENKIDIEENKEGEKAGEEEKSVKEEKEQEAKYMSVRSYIRFMMLKRLRFASTVN